MPRRISRDLRAIEISKLKLWKEGNVRKTDALVDLEDLAKNIRQNDLQVPLVVLEEERNKSYLIISGQRRFEACKAINYSPIDCIVLKDVSLEEAKIMSLSENLYRLQMNPDDIADAVYSLYQTLHSIAKVAERLGVSESKVRKYLGYRNVPESIKKLVRARKITASQAVIVHSQFPQKERQDELALELSKIQNNKEKSKFVQAIKEASPRDDLNRIRKRASYLKELKSFTIYLPPKTSNAIEKVATEMDIEPAFVLAQIIEYWVDERSSRGLSIVA